MDKIKRYREIQNKYGDDLSKMPPEILEEYKTLQTYIRNNYTPIELGETVSAKPIKIMSFIDCDFGA